MILHPTLLHAVHLAALPPPAMTLQEDDDGGHSYRAQFSPTLWQEMRAAHLSEQVPYAVIIRDGVRLWLDRLYQERRRRALALRDIGGAGAGE